MGYENVITANKARAKHGMHNTREYQVWMQMQQRCYNPSKACYARYGGRGITVCERWRSSFPAFYADMGDAPAGTTLDRVDNEKGYAPDNCRWATPQEQANNRVTNVVIEHDGKTMTIAEWARHLGLPYHWIKHRHKRGYTPPELFSVEHLPYRKARMYEYQGKQMSIKEISQATGIKLQTLYARLYAGNPLI